ncbi:MAG: hypothetical protein PHV06_09610 [bacterium]|nr:hypothetical protein [bacterium]
MKKYGFSLLITLICVNAFSINLNIKETIELPEQLHISNKLKLEGYCVNNYHKEEILKVYNKTGNNIFEMDLNEKGKVYNVFVKESDNHIIIMISVQKLIKDSGGKKVERYYFFILNQAGESILKKSLKVNYFFHAFPNEEILRNSLVNINIGNIYLNYQKKFLIFNLYKISYLSQNSLNNFVFTTEIDLKIIHCLNLETRIRNCYYHDEYFFIATSNSIFKFDYTNKKINELRGDAFLWKNYFFEFKYNSNFSLIKIMKYSIDFNLLSEAEMTEIIIPYKVFKNNNFIYIIGRDNTNSSTSIVKFDENIKVKKVAEFKDEIFKVKETISNKELLCVYGKKNNSPYLFLIAENDEYIYSDKIKYHIDEIIQFSGNNLRFTSKNIVYEMKIKYKGGN